MRELNGGFSNWYDKRHGEEIADEISRKGYPSVDFLLSDLFEWLENMNWPGALKIADFLITIGEPVIPHIRKVLTSRDNECKGNLISYVVRELPASLIERLEVELLDLAHLNTPGGLGLEIAEILVEKEIGDKNELMKIVLDNWIQYKSLFEQADKVSKANYLRPVRNVFERITNAENDIERMEAFNDLIGFDGEKYSEDSFVMKQINRIQQNKK
ncbi:MAG: DUF5071 domain-containing protein [Bacillota bacterium]|nr:DUF5071 domain-containing protein [Bacillota bacterium]